MIIAHREYKRKSVEGRLFLFVLVHGTAYLQFFFIGYTNKTVLRCTIWSGNQNYVELWGVAAGEPVFSHENHTRRFDKFPLRVGAPVRPERHARHRGERGTAARVCPVEEGQSLRIVGQLRSFNNKSGQGNRLVITVFAQSIEPGDGSYFNRILLSGALCKKPVLRRTPLGRSICDVILAVNRHYGRADYLPCIAWGQTAVQIAGMDVGERLALEGRVQSRTYTKLLESGSEERTAFEVSIMQLLDEEETEETALL